MAEPKTESEPDRYLNPILWAEKIIVGSAVKKYLGGAFIFLRPHFEKRSV